MIEKRFPGLFQKFPKLNPAAYEPYHFYLDELETSYYTGLQVNKDPGVPFVWIGFFMIMTGLFVTFFMSHRGIWIRISPDDEELIISVAGRSNKNPVGLDRELDQLVQKIDRKLS
jgi:cytochrome c biogenesis protein